ncbi:MULTISPECIES: type II toxin-antitoxin system prevent-host-death family antitoxin [Paraburkholderia]|uniref:Type II toxin-antitoxin system prevent-host-death family antitoxin n=1 Tax=Paraburkholderia podalyriae TaxID=1938811 RepID=A0ABR7PWS2_9BURK|nr:type II toxin-antitoxin system prevent-host-death family antitoxin [Paraburkholderia podalyriae]MBC8750740.1 type II toxin-antitoxin system prevent-host-death family antitoxin [Paraburkholderia podalyriae]
MGTRSTEPMVTITVDDLDRDPEGVLRTAEQIGVTICKENKPVAMFVPIEAWREYLRRLEGLGDDAPNG